MQCASSSVLFTLLSNIWLVLRCTNFSLFSTALQTLLNERLLLFFVTSKPALVRFIISTRCLKILPSLLFAVLVILKLFCRFFAGLCSLIQFMSTTTNSLSSRLFLEQGSTLILDALSDEYQWCFFGVSNPRSFIPNSGTIITAPWRKKENTHFYNRNFGVIVLSVFTSTWSHYSKN